MRYRHFVWVWVFIFGAVCSAAQQSGGNAAPGEQYLGRWTGTWDGAGTGGFELMLEKDAAGGIAGKVSVTGEPTYKAAFKALSFQGKEMSARYDFPADERAEVVLAGTFDGTTARGTWSLREKGTDNEVARGGWTVTHEQP